MNRTKNSCLTILYIANILALTGLAYGQTNYEASKRSHVPQVFGRLGESVTLECGKEEHELLKQLESNSNTMMMPVLVNWYKHFSQTRRNEKPIYAKYLANNIDYEPHVARDYENRIQVTNRLDLNITSLKAVDEALYECRLILFDKAYAESHTGYMAYLQVHVAPEFEFPNEEIVYYKPNVPTRLYCYAKGKPSPTISWYRNGEQLHANTSVLQQILPLDEQTADIYEYKCRAENLVGRIEHTFKVIRSGSLFFTEQLKNLTVAEGTILNWPCLAQSNAEIQYKWFKDSIAVQSHLHKWPERGALFQDGMLYLLETYRNDSGWYECHAYTANNKRIETIAYLNVLYGPEIAPFPSPFYAAENSHSIVIDCQVKSNPSIVALEWFKDKYLLSNTPKYQILPNNSLLIRNVQKTDRGQYYCTCNNTLRKAVSPIVKLEILDAKIYEIQTLISYTNQSVTVLPCKIKNLPANYLLNTDVNWYKLNSKLVRQDRIYTNPNNGSLLVQNARSSDSGIYMCKLSEESASNENPTPTNSDEILIKLIVVQIKTDASGSSSELLDTNNKARTNDHFEIPLSPTNIRLNQSLNGLLISWSYPSHTPTPIDYFQIYYRKEKSLNHEWKTTEPIDSGRTSFLIDESNLNENQLYELQLVSFNSMSKSLPSQIMRVKYAPRQILSFNTKNNDDNYQDDQNDYVTSTKVFMRHKDAKRPLVKLVEMKKMMQNYFENMTQLDFVLIAVFCLLLLILIVCLASFIVYKRSYKKLEAEKKDMKNGDMDDWGFQSSSSAATATFLSSSSASSNDASDKFLPSNHQTRPEIDYNQKTPILIKQKYNNSSMLSRETIPRNSVRIIATKNQQHEAFRSNSYRGTLLTRKSNPNTLYFKTSINQDHLKNSNQNQNNNNNNNNNCSSGIESANSTLLSDENVHNNAALNFNDILDYNAKHSFPPVSTIKYNAKTNCLSKEYRSILNEKNVDDESEETGVEIESNRTSADLKTATYDDEKQSSILHANNANLNAPLLHPTPPLPFPTSHFQSNSSLTLVSTKLPSVSHCFTNTANGESTEAMIANQNSQKVNTFSSNSSTSSGCSSLELINSSSHKSAKKNGGFTTTFRHLTSRIEFV